MATRTELLTEYVERSKDYELPDHLEQALEDDYLLNRSLYSGKTFICIKALYLLHPEVTPETLLQSVRA